MGCALTLSLTSGLAPIHHAHAGAVRMHHRGPDNNGVVERDLGWTRVAVGMARLAIVDTRYVSVPFVYPHLGIVLGFNGEVYNHRDLRAELSDGTPWETDCDAEVVARAWRRWGPAMLHRLNGMFALAIVDEQSKEAFIARDRAGEKPLYYTGEDDIKGPRHYASEIKGLPGPLVERAKWPPEALALEFDCLEDTLFEGVRSMPPGSFEHHTAFGVASGQWWSLPLPDEPPRGPFAQKILADRYETDLAELTALVTDAIRIRVAAEVPVALLISGGLDSAIIQAVAKVDRLYTATFPADGYDFVREAERGAQGCPVCPVTFHLGDLKDALRQIAYHLDTPATWTSVAQWFLMRAVSQNGARVVMSGEGADELFFGYSRYRTLWHLDRLRADPLLTAYGPTVDRLVGGRDDTLARLLNRGGDATLSVARGLVRRFGAGRSMAEDCARVEWHTTMQCLLRMADRMSAAWSLENRSPFLDYRIAEFAARLPLEFKINERYNKRILRDVARRLGVADSIIEETTKVGFLIPWPQWTQAPPGSWLWDRTGFAAMMVAAWREAYAGRVAA